MVGANHFREVTIDACVEARGSKVLIHQHVIKHLSLSQFAVDNFSSESVSMYCLVSEESVRNAQAVCLAQVNHVVPGGIALGWIVASPSREVPVFSFMSPITISISWVGTARISSESWDRNAFWTVFECRA